MDIFRFITPTSPTFLSYGQLINGIKTKLWTERYRDMCDFELVANADQMVHKLLTRGTLISHTKTSEVMVVENHEIVDDKGSQTEVKITGRSFESIFESRIVGSNQAWPTADSATIEYLLSAGYTWDQAVELIRNHIYASEVIDANDAIPNIEVITNVPGTGDVEERYIKRGDLYTRLIEQLKIDNLGVKTVRPGRNSTLGPTNPNIGIIIHKGSDRSSSVVFSSITGEIESADYLWSNKLVRNAALVTGRWVETVVKHSEVGYQRRMMFIDASDIDNSFSEAPTGSDRDAVIAAFTIIGNATLASQKEVTLIKTEASKTANMYKYRTDYNVGDIIMVDGQYNETTKMQVSEYVEIEDENGEIGYPTLSQV